MYIYSLEKNGWTTSMLDDLITSEKIVVVKTDIDFIEDLSLIDPNIVEVLDTKFNDLVEDKNVVELKKTPYECEQIPLKDLEVGKWYIGRGRRANIGLWNGNSFSVLGDCGVWTGSVKTTTEKEECIKHENYYTDKEGSFQPFLKVDFGETISKIEENGFGGGYGKKIRFK